LGKKGVKSRLSYTLFGDRKRVEGGIASRGREAVRGPDEDELERKRKPRKKPAPNLFNREQIDEERSFAGLSEANVFNVCGTRPSEEPRGSAW